MFRRIWITSSTLSLQNTIQIVLRILLNRACQAWSIWFLPSSIFTDFSILSILKTAVVTPLLKVYFGELIICVLGQSRVSLLITSPSNDHLTCHIVWTWYIWILNHAHQIILFKLCLYVRGLIHSMGMAPILQTGNHLILVIILICLNIVELFLVAAWLK